MQNKISVFEDALKAKEEEAAELKRKLSEMETTKESEFLQRQAEIEQREAKMMAEIEEERARRALIETEAKAKEEALVAQMQAKEESLRQQASLLEEQLSKDRHTFDQEVQLLRRTLEEREQADAGDRTMMKELQAQLQQAKSQMAKSSSEYIERSAFEDEFTCSICQELLLDARTLDCAHTFCATCLEEWRKQKAECPICRKKIDKPALRALNLDSIVSRLVAKLTPEDKQEWDRRMNARSERQQVEKLKEMIEMAKKRKLRFLDVRAPWSEVEKQTFKDGVSYAPHSRPLF